MSKRKREGVLASQQTGGNNGKNYLSPKLPTDLWVHLAEFLNFRDLASFSYLRKNFFLIALQAMTNLYKERFIDFPFSYFPLASNPSQFSEYISQLKILNTIRKFYDDQQYYTLFDPAYIELFRAIEARKTGRAKKFIESQLRLNKNKVIDRVFYQKLKGETAISRASICGLQDLLDFCFQRLILETPQSDRNKEGIVSTGHYSEVISELNSHLTLDEVKDDDIRKEVFFTYACAHLCKRKSDQKTMSETPVWKSAWKLKDKLDLLYFAILLSNFDLTKSILYEIRGEDDNQLMAGFTDYNYYYPAYDADEPFLHNAEIVNNCNITKLTLMFRNEEIIDEVLSFYQGRDWEDIETNIIYFIMDRRDLPQLRHYCESNKEYKELFVEPPCIANKYLNVHSVHRLIPINLAITLNWLPGVECMVESGTSFIDDGVDLDRPNIHPLSLAVELGRLGIVKYLLSQRINPNGFDNPGAKALLPIFHAVKQNSLLLVKLLVENKASLEIENKQIKDCHRYPLIGAVLEENEEIKQYILQKLGITKAQEQLKAALSFLMGSVILFDSNPNKCRFLIEKLDQQLRASQRVSEQKEPQAKHSGTNCLTKNELAPLLKLPPALWVFTGTFLAEKDWVHFLQTNQKFAFSILQLMRDVDYYEFSLPFSIRHLMDLSKRLYKIYASIHPCYYTLFDCDYIQLFKWVEQRNLQKIRDFIELNGADPYLMDKVFYQKNGYGDTAVTLAGKLKFQPCLDYFFNTFVVNLQWRGVFNLERYQNTLGALNWGNWGRETSDEALRLFACTFVCEQHAVCEQIFATPGWDITGTKPPQYLSMMAAMLGSVKLFDFVLHELDESGLIELTDIWMTRYHSSYELYANRQGDSFSTIDMIAVSKNNELVKKLDSVEFNKTSFMRELIFFSIQQKDIKTLEKICRQKKEALLTSYSAFPNTYFRIQSKHLLNPLGMAIAQNWLEGIQFLLTNGCFSLQEEKNSPQPILDPLSIAVDFGYYPIAKYLLSQGANPNGSVNRENKNSAPIFYAIKNNNLAMVQLLIQNKASTSYNFPLIHAFLLRKIQIVEYLIKIIGFSAAIVQVEKVRNFNLGPPQNRILIEKFYNKLNKMMIFHANQNQQTCQSSTSLPGLSPMQ